MGDTPSGPNIFLTWLLNLSLNHNTNILKQFLCSIVYSRIEVNARLDLFINTPHNKTTEFKIIIKM